MAESTDQEQYSDEVKKILYKRPAWLVQWGVLFLLAIFIIISVGAWFMPYPIKLSLPMTLKDSAGIVIVPGQYKGSVTSESRVSVLVSDRDPETRTLYSASIISEKPDTLTGQLIVMVRIPVEARRNPARGAKGSQYYLQIITRESNLLDEVFRPFTGLFSGGATQKNK